MLDARLSLVKPPRVPFAGALAARIAVRIEPLIRPSFALVTMLALMTAGFYFGKGIPAVELGIGGDLFPGHLYLTKIVWLAIALVLVALSRAFPSHRDIMGTVSGLVVYTVGIGWRATLLLVIWLLVSFYILKFLNQQFALLIAGIGMVASAKLLPAPAVWGTYWFLALAGGRVAYYAFDRRYLRKRDVSLLRAFNYCFTPLLFLGPDLPPYPQFARPEPRATTDRNAARLFYWAGIKVVLVVALVQLQHKVLPDPMHFDDLGWSWKTFVVLNCFVSAEFLRVFAAFDLCAALANLAGHHVPDASEAPFLGPTLFSWFRRYSVNVINFYRRVAVLELTRRFRGRVGFVLVITAAVAANLLHHTFLFGLLQPKKPVLKIFMSQSPVSLLLFFVAAYVMERAYLKYWPIARFIFMPVSLFVASIVMFNPAVMWFGYGTLGKGVTPERVDCFFQSYFTGAHCGVAPAAMSPWVWDAVPCGMVLASTVLVIILGRLVPAFRAPVDTSAPANQRTVVETL